MSTMSLVLTSVLIIIPLFVSYKSKLELEKDIIVSMVRAIIQLLVVGYLLEFIFGLESAIFTAVLVLIMIVNAAQNTRKRGEGIKNVFVISFISLSVGTFVTMAVLVLAGAIEFNPNEVVPVAGMVVSNAMVAVGLSYRNLKDSFKNKRDEVEVKLSLGADIMLASKEIIRESIKIAMIPSLDSAKTLGIVSLPGMMTGLILAGESPVVAVKFQIMVTFMLVSSVTVAAMISTYMAYRNFFNERKQLNV